MSQLPLKLVLQVNATNGSTMLSGLEQVVEILKQFRFPKRGQKLISNVWEAQVMEVSSSLDFRADST